MTRSKDTPFRISAGNLLEMIRIGNGGELPRCRKGTHIGTQSLTLTLTRSSICQDPDRFAEAVRRLRALKVAVLLSGDDVDRVQSRLIIRALDTCKVHRGKDEVTVVLSEMWVRSAAEGYRWEYYRVRRRH